MPYALDTYTGDGTKTDFEVTFPYIQRDQVRVFQDTTELQVITDGEPTAGEYKWEDNDTILVGSPPPSGTPLKVLRNTPKGDQIVDWVNGSYIVANDLNTSDLQWLYSIQELIDRIDAIDGTVVGEAVKTVTGTAPIEVDNTDPQEPIVEIDETVSTDDPNALTSDTRVMSELAADTAFKQYIGTSPTTGNKLGQIRIDDTGAAPVAFYWNGTAWVQLTLVGPEGPQGPPGPPPGLQDPAASAATIPLNPDGTLGTATADVLQDPTTGDLKYLFGIPQGLTGDTGLTGPPGPPPGLQDPAALASSVPVKGDGTVGDATAAVSQDGDGNLLFSFGVPVGETGAVGPQGPPGSGIDYKGSIDATTAPAPADPRGGDLYVNLVDGTSSWPGLSAVFDGSRLVYNAHTSQWDEYTPTYATDLGYTAAANQGTITNTNGTDAVIPVVDLSDAGLMTPTELGKLNGIEEGAQVNPDLSNYLEKGDNVSELTNDAGYITAADIPPSASTLQEVLDNGNTATVSLWIGDNGETIKLLPTGSLEASGGVTAAFGTDTAQLGNVMPRDDWSSIPART